MRVEAPDHPSLPTVADSTLLDGLKARDPRLSTAFYLRYYPKLIAYTGAITGKENEDLAQEALIKFLRAIDRNKFDKRARISTYLFRITVNAWIDQIRRQKWMVGSGIPTDPKDVEVVADRVAFVEDALESGLDLEGALEKLPKDRADMIRQSFFRDRTNGEIAQQLGIPEGTVKSRMYRTAELMRGIMGDDYLVMTG